MVYEISIGNFLLLSQGTQSPWKVETLESAIRLSDSARSNLIPQNLVHHLALNQLVVPHKNIINIAVEHGLQLQQLTHPRSNYFNVVHTVPLQSNIDLPAYGPVVSELNLSQIVSFYVATPTYSTIALTQIVTATVVRLMVIEHTIPLVQFVSCFIADKRWMPNRGNYIPPNAEFVWDVNVRNFVKIPDPLTFNPETGYYEGTNEDSFFVQSNGFVLWP